MSFRLNNLTLAVIGGDERQVIVASRLLDLGAKLKVLGLPHRDELVGAEFTSDLLKVIENVDVVLLPVPGTDNEGNIYNKYSNHKIQLTEDIFCKIPDYVPIFIGVAKPFLKEWAEKYNKKLIEILNLDDVAILNSIPTAEGAIQIAMQELPITIHGSKSVVLGFGRCGKTLARILDALGANTIVFARKSKDLARIKEMGLIPKNYNELERILPEADIIFNTVPTLILNKQLLNILKKDVLIIDIASAPGGTDFLAAEKLGIKAILASGLPGKVAPKSAGLILADILPNLILQKISLSRKNEIGGQ